MNGGAAISQFNRAIFAVVITSGKVSLGFY